MSLQNGDRRTHHSDYMSAKIKTWDFEKNYAQNWGRIFCENTTF